MKKISLLLLLPVILLASCEKEFKIPLPKADYKPVLNTFLTADSQVFVRVNVSVRPEHSGGAEPATATVLLYEDGVFKETLQALDTPGMKFYVSQYKVVAGRQYRVTAQVGGYDLAEGTDIIPDRNTTIMSDKDSYISLNADGNPETNLNFSLTYHGSGKGYYQYRVYAPYRRWVSISGTDTTWEEGRTMLRFRDKDQNSGLFEDSDSYTHNTGNIFESHVLNPGETTRVTLVSADWSFDVQDSIQVEICQMSEASYRYLQGIKTMYNSNDDPTAEKAIIYSNIKNGFGIVGGMTFHSESFNAP